MITKIENVKRTYENEKDTKFPYSLQQNAVAPYNDSYKGYIEYLIDREKSQGVQCNSDTMKYYQELLKRYDAEEMALDRALSSSSGSTASTVTARTVFDAKQTLFGLSNTGKKIKELCTRQITAQKSEHKNTEMVFEDVNQGVRQRKIKQNKQKGKPKNKNQHSQNKNDKRPDSDRGRNNFNNRGRQSIPDLRYINPRSHFPQNQYYSPMPSQHMQYPFGMYGHQNAFPQQGYMGPQYAPPPNFSNYRQLPQHYGNPQFFQGPPMFQQQYPNYQTQPQQGNYFPAQASFTSNNPDFTNNRQNDKNSTASDSSIDTDFRNWYLKLNASSDDIAPPKKIDNTAKYNTRSQKYVPEDSSDDSDNVPKENSDSDDEDFKKFMRENGVEYLVKESSNTSAKANKKTNTNQKNENNNNFPNQPRNYRRQDDSDSDDDNNSKAKSKGFFSNLLNEIL